MVKIEVRPVIRPATEDFGELWVNDHFVYRFDRVNQAEIVAENLAKSFDVAVQVSNSTVKRIK